MATDTGFGQVRFFDEFLGDLLEDAWTGAASGSGTAFAMPSTALTNGVVEGVVTNNSSTDVSVLYGDLNWQADDGGPLVFEARCQIVTSLSQLVFIGLSDQKTTERPIDYNGGTLTTTATDAVGFYYAGGEASATWRIGGVKNGTDSTHYAVASRFNPVLSTWQTFRVVVNSDGSASFYINGEIIRENVANCVTITTSLLPYFALTDDGAAGRLYVDYCYVCKGRA